MNKTPPKASIVLPTHNGAKYLRESIDSCLSQTYEDIELIIVDDASTDSTHEIITSYSDKRIRRIRNDRHLGLANSLNEGFSSTRGDYLTWTSDDNSYSQTAIEVMAGKLDAHKRIDFVYANYYLIDEDASLLSKKNVGSTKEMDRTSCIGPCFLYRRKVYEGTGRFNPDLIVAEDYEYWLRVRKKFRMQRISDYLYYYRVHEGSLTSKHSLDVRMKAKEFIKNKYISSSTKHCFAGEKFYYQKDYCNAKKSLARSLLLNPCNLDALRILSFIFLPSCLVGKVREIKQAILK